MVNNQRDTGTPPSHQAPPCHTIPNYYANVLKTLQIIPILERFFIKFCVWETRKQKSLGVIDFEAFSTQSRDRTGMEVNPLVFETSASTNSAIWAFAWQR